MARYKDGHKQEAGDAILKNAAERSRRDSIAAGGVRGRFKKARRRWLARETRHLSFASSDGEMRVLCAIVLAQTSRTMSISKTNAIERRAIVSQSVRDDSRWFDLLILQ